MGGGGGLGGYTQRSGARDDKEGNEKCGSGWVGRGEGKWMVSTRTKRKAQRSSYFNRQTEKNLTKPLFLLFLYVFFDWIVLDSVKMTWQS